MPESERTTPAAAISRARLLEREDLSPNLAIFRLELDSGVPPFRAGQWIVLGLPDPVDPGRTVWRPYSISSPPEEQRHLELYIRRVWKPVPGLLTTLLWELAPGEALFWRRPKGKFIIDDPIPGAAPDLRRILMVAGGTGLAPFVSQVRHLFGAGTQRELVLIHGASYVEELGYRSLFEELAGQDMAAGQPWRFRYLPTISRPQHERNSGWTGLKGRVESLLTRPAADRPAIAEDCVGALLTPRDTFAMVCGYELTIDNVLAELQPRGFRDHRHAREDGSFDLKADSYG